MKPVILCLIGPSGCGKTTLSLWLARTFYGVNTMVSYTTRPMREGETDGVQHYFVGSKEYLKYRNNPLAYTVFGGYEYWTTLHQIEEHALNVYVIDEAGVNYLRSHYTDKYEIYVCVMSRHDIQPVIPSERTSRDKGRVQLDKDADYYICNDGTLDDLYMKVSGTIIRMIIRMQKTTDDTQKVKITYRTGGNTII